MRKGQVITTPRGVCGIISRITTTMVEVKWITNGSGQTIAGGDGNWTYSIGDIERGINDGSLTLGNVNDPNLIFLTRKRDANS